MDAKDITTRYHVEQGDQYSVTVKVDFSLPEDTGTQYVQLGSTRLEYVLPLASTGASAESATEKQSGSDTMTVVLWSLAIVAGAALALFILLLLYVRLRYDLRRAVRSWKRRNAVKKSLYLSIPGPDVQPVEQIPQKTKTDFGTAGRQPKSKRYQ